jgi:soluble cytochrome b562
MRKPVIALLTASVLLATSASVLARDLEEDMDILNDSYKTVLKTDSLSEMKTELTTMRAAAMDAMKATPPKLADKAPDSPEIQEYHKGLTLLVGQIDGALKLADAGKLPEARAAAEEFKQTRNTYHKKFR